MNEIEAMLAAAKGLSESQSITLEAALQLMIAYDLRCIHWHLDQTMDHEEVNKTNAHSSRTK